MMYHMKKSLCIVSLLLPSLMVCAQSDSAKVDKVNNLRFGLEFMTHGEIMRGGLPAEDNAYVEDKSNFLLGRTRITAGYSRPGIEASVVLQNTAVWGTGGEQTLGLYEGWAKVTAKMGLFAQVGRVALSYDDERIIGTNDFAMAALSHDVLRVGYEGHGHQAHAIVAYNQNAENVYYNTYYRDGEQPYKSMETVWYHYDVPKFPLGVSLLFMNCGLQAGKPETSYNPPRTVNQQMYGTYLNFHPKYLTFEGSYYRQAGKTVNPVVMGATKIDAWMASAKATVNPSDYYGFTIGYDYLSGDDYVPVIYGGHAGMPLHAVNKGFSPLYGSRTKFYGIMDYFYQRAYINGFTPGLQNAFFGVSGKPVSQLDLNATYHYMAVATHLDGLNNTLGHCIDVMASYDFSKYISLTAGYSLMIGTETMDRLKQGNGTGNAHWGWFSLVISPTLFTTKF